MSVVTIARAANVFLLMFSSNMTLVVYGEVEEKKVGKMYAISQHPEFLLESFSIKPYKSVNHT